MGLIQRFTRAPVPVEPAGTKSRFSLEGLAAQLNFLGHTYPSGILNQTMMGDTESPDTSFVGLTMNAYRDCGPVFALILARAMLFSEARFQWQRFEDGRPGVLFGTPALRRLEEPWPNGTTREMLWRAEQDVSLAGNSYLRLHRDRLWRLRPDYMHIVLGSQTQVDDPAAAIDAEVAGFIWVPPGSNEPTFLLPEEVAHWSPIPDPLAHYKGMSWITAAGREINADRSAVVHKQQFFDKGATVNLIIMPDATVSYDEFKVWKEEFEDEHEGAWNAYKTLFLGGGSQVTKVGSTLAEMDYKNMMGIAETRMAADAGVPPIIAGFSEGLQSATYANYGMARRKFGDHWGRPQWGSFAAAHAKLVTPKPAGASRLWYDDRDIPFLREDMADEAKIKTQDAQTARLLIDGGFKPDAVVTFIQTGNADALLGEHSGKTSVQLIPLEGTVDSDSGTGNSNDN